MEKQDLSKRLEFLREQKGWTKTYVAKKLQLKNMATYANWEYGTREPDNKSLTDLARLYNVSIDYLVTGTSSYKKVADPTEDLDKMLDEAMSFDGKPLTDYDKEAIRAFMQGRKSSEK